MKLIHTALTTVVLAITVSITGVFEPAHAQVTCEHIVQPVTIEGADTHIYSKSAEGAELRLHIFNPPNHAATSKDASIIFFFGGGWVDGSVEQFVPQSIYLARRGMVAIVADYRVWCRHSSNPFDSVDDALSAIWWVRAHAAELGIDPMRIAAGGGSSGGQIALSAAFLEPRKGTEGVDFKPDALVLYNPALDLTTEGMKQRFGAAVADRIQLISPLRHIRKGLPPTLIMNGKDDTQAYYEVAKKYCAKASALANSCQLVGYDGAEHGFFRPNVEGGKWYRATLLEVDHFLTALGYLPGPSPTEISE